jgi:hypothetical protein
MHVIPACPRRRVVLRDSVYSDSERVDGTIIETIALLVAFAWYTILLENCADQGNTRRLKPLEWDLELHEVVSVSCRAMPAPSCLLCRSVLTRRSLVIDGSGVLTDPAGINREELVRLAKFQVPVEHFDKSKLSRNGFLVRVEDQDVKLPCMSSCDQSRVADDAFCFSQPVRSFWMARTSLMRRTFISRLIYLSLAEDGEQGNRFLAFSKCFSHQFHIDLKL